MNYSQQQNARRVRFLSQEIFDQWLADTYSYECFNDIEKNVPAFVRESFELLQAGLISQLLNNSLTLDQLQAVVNPLVSQNLALIKKVIELKTP